MNDEFEELIKVVRGSAIQDYDSVAPESQSDKLKGMRTKKFVRCDSRVFEDLINEIRVNPNCSYVTYMNDIIKSGYTPKVLSVLLKENNVIMGKRDNTGLGHYRDVCASRILNYLGCPTSYETLMYIDDNIVGCSVDFGIYGKDFYPLNTLCGYGDRDDIVDNLTLLKSMLQNLNNKNSFKNFELLEEKFLNEYVYNYFIRRYVLMDGDCWFNNFGIMVDDKSFELSPNFDFEYCFDFATSESKQTSYYKRCAINLRYIKLKYPEIYNKITNKVEKIISGIAGEDSIITLIKNEIGNGVRASEFVDKFKNHLTNLSKVISNEHTNEM